MMAMYDFTIANTKTERIMNEYIALRDDIKIKLEKLKIEPRIANGAHQLHGKLQGKWACWLGSNIRMIYIIDDTEKIITILAVGTHKLY